MFILYYCCLCCYYCFCCFDCFLLAAILLQLFNVLQIYNIMKIERNNKGNLVGMFESHVNLDNGFTNESQGIRVSEMELFTNPNGTPIFIEWVVDDGTFIEHIGLWFDGRTLVDYDGVFELPVQAAKLIRKAGYKVPKELLTV